jgi:general secretion pathway protein H
VLAAAVPASVRFYESMQARQAVRDTVALLASARERRFYPEGGASGGGIDLQRRDGSGTAVNVDWLVGRVSQEPLRRE